MRPNSDNPLILERRSIEQSKKELEEWINVIPEDTDEYSYAIQTLENLKEREEGIKEKIFSVLKEGAERRRKQNEFFGFVNNKAETLDYDYDFIKQHWPYEVEISDKDVRKKETELFIQELSQFKSDDEFPSTVWGFHYNPIVDQKKRFVRFKTESDIKLYTNNFIGEKYEN